MNTTTTTISYQLNGEHLDGWDETDYDTIDLHAAADNLTDWQPGDILTATLHTLDEHGRLVVVDEQSLTL